MKIVVGPAQNWTTGGLKMDKNLAPLSSSVSLSRSRNNQMVFSSHSLHLKSSVYCFDVNRVTMATASKTNVSLKLLIDTKAKRVLFAEAGKDFVDFLFNLLHLPVGTVVKLLKKQNMVGTLGNLYDSIENLNETYFQSNQTKDCVLKPKAPLSATQVPLLSLEGGTSSAERYYTCPYYSSGHLCVSQNSSAICTSCKNSLSREMQYVAAGNEVAAVGEEGFVKGVVTYMVMDDLMVTPMSTISGITMLNKFNVKEVGALEERVVDLGMPEGLKLLKASFQSKMVLTRVFLGNTGGNG